MICQYSKILKYDTFTTNLQLLQFKKYFKSLEMFNLEVYLLCLLKLLVLLKTCSDVIVFIRLIVIIEIKYHK